MAPYTQMRIQYGGITSHMQDHPTAELLEALSKFQSAVLAAHKDAEGYGYKYATLTSITKAIQPTKAAGLCHVFIQQPLAAMEGGQPGFTNVELRLYHAKSGGVLTSSRLIADWDPENRKAPKHQQTGAAISYAKRYLLADMFGIATEENEGETIVAPDETPKGAKAKPQPVTPTKAKTAAPPAVDPLAESKAAVQAQLVELYGKDPQVLGSWQKHVKNRWNGNTKVAQDKLKVEHLTTAEMVADTKEWIENYNKVPQA